MILLNGGRHDHRTAAAARLVRFYRSNPLQNVCRVGQQPREREGAGISRDRGNTGGGANRGDGGLLQRIAADIPNHHLVGRSQGRL